MSRLSVAGFGLLMAACSVTTHEVTPSALGSPSSWAAMEARLEEAGPIRFERVIAADWEVPLGGLLDLEAPEVKEAGLQDRSEPIAIYMYALHHPSKGTYLVDAGVPADLHAEDSELVSWPLRSEMNTDAIRIRESTRAWLARQSKPLAGVLLTHLHLDHVLGLPDVPSEVPVFIGPAESEDRRFLNMFVQGTIDRVLQGKVLRELASTPEGVWDLFGDGSVFAIHTPGHTQGSLAFVVRSNEGPVLLTGDTCHTTFGWQHGVISGHFTTDAKGQTKSLEALRSLARRHPEMAVHIGHQPVDGLEALKPPEAEASSRR